MWHIFIQKNLKDDEENETNFTSIAITKKERAYAAFALEI